MEGKGAGGGGAQAVKTTAVISQCRQDECRPACEPFDGNAYQEVTVHHMNLLLVPNNTASRKQSNMTIWQPKFLLLRQPEGGSSCTQWGHYLKTTYAGYDHVQCPDAAPELYLVARGQVAHFGQLHLVYMHQQLYSSLPDLQCRHVGQEVIAHKEAHEHCRTRPCVKNCRSGNRCQLMLF